MQGEPTPTGREHTPERERQPRTAGAWPIFVLLAAAIVLPVLIFFVSPKSGGRAQFEQMFSESAPARAQALDYWSTTFRGSKPRLYDSTIVDARLNERMRRASDEVAIDFYRVFAQDPDLVMEFRPAMLRGIVATINAASDPPTRAKTLADLLTLLRQERAEAPATGPTLTEWDHRQIARYINLHARAMQTTPAEDGPAREAEQRSLLAAAMLLSPDAARHAGEAIGKPELGAKAAADALRPLEPLNTPTPKQPDDDPRNP